MPNPFNVQTSKHDDLAVLALDGFLDAHTAPAFEQAIQKEIEQGNRRIVVACDKLTYISSAGLGVFMSFIEEIREAGGDIKICGAIPKVRQVFEMTDFNIDPKSDLNAQIERVGAGVEANKAAKP